MNLVYLVYLFDRDRDNTDLIHVYRVEQLDALRKLLDAATLLSHEGASVANIYFDIYDTDAQRFVSRGLAVLEEAE